MSAMLPYNLAAYLDEADDDPVTACAIIAKAGLRHVAVRRLWSTPIAAASDHACQRLAAALRDYKLTLPLVASDCGLVPYADLAGQVVALKRALLIASYFRARYLRIYAGIGNRWSDRTAAVAAVDSWLAAATAAAQASTLTLVVGVSHDALNFDIDAMRRLLAAHPSLLYHYNPVPLIIRRQQDPTAYWQAFRQRVHTVDLCDYQIGQSFRPFGHGSCRWASLRADLNMANLWLFIEPGLGRRYGTASARSQTFTLALEAITAFLTPPLAGK